MTFSLSFRTMTFPIVIYNIFNRAFNTRPYFLKRKEVRELDRSEISEDMVTMRDGRVMIMRNGELMPMEEEMTLSNGTRVMQNGRVQMADGTARMMSEGETMDMDGQSADPAQMSDRKFKEEMEDEELRDEIGGDEND